MFSISCSVFLACKNPSESDDDSRIIYDTLVVNEDTLIVDSTGRIHNQLIIQYNEAVPESEREAFRNSSLRDKGFTLTKKCSSCADAIELWNSEGVIDPETVLSSARDRTTADSTGANYNHLTTDQPPQVKEYVGINDSLPPLPTTGDIVRVAIVDSGVDTDHAELMPVLGVISVNAPCYPSGNRGFGYDYTEIVAQGNTTYRAPEDEHGHGTQVNGAVSTYLPSGVDIRILNTKFFTTQQGTVFDAVCGIYHAIAEEVDIINLSWGFKTDKENFPSILYNALKETEEEKILVTTSAGNTSNDNDTINKYPANFDLDNIIAVTSYEIHGDNTVLADYANYGSENVDIAAHGYLETTIKNGNRGGVNGTSIAAPRVAQAAAIIMNQYPNLTYEEVRECIFSTTDNLTPDPNKEIKHGALNLQKALECAQQASLP